MLVNNNDMMFYAMKFSGELIAEFQAQDVPVSFSLLEDGKNMIVVLSDANEERCVQIISYID